MQRQNEIISQISIEAINNLNFDHASSDVPIIHGMKSIAKGLLSFVGLRENPYYITWRTGMLAKALFRLNEVYDGNRINIESELNSYFDRYISRNGIIKKLDNIQNGEVAIWLYEKNKKQQYLSLIDSYKTFVKNHIKDSEGALPFLDNYDIYVDGLMICPFVLLYNSNIEKNDVLYEIAINQIMAYIKNGIDKRTLLPFHGYNLSTGMQLGIPGWGRGTGWFLYSVIDSIQYVNENESRRSVIIKAYKDMIDSALDFQRNDGLFSWCLLSPNGPIDTSATSMILYAVVKGVNMGILDDRYKSFVLRGYKSIRKYIKDGKIYQAMGDCRGFGMYPQVYDSYPWSLAFFLLLFVEILNLKNEENGL